MRANSSRALRIEPTSLMRGGIRPPPPPLSRGGAQTPPSVSPTTMSPRWTRTPPQVTGTSLATVTYRPTEVEGMTVREKTGKWASRISSPSRTPASSTAPPSPPPAPAPPGGGGRPRHPPAPLRDVAGSLGVLRADDDDRPRLRLVDGLQGVPRRLRLQAGALQHGDGRAHDLRRHDRFDLVGHQAGALRPPVHGVGHRGRGYGAETVQQVTQTRNGCRLTHGTPPSRTGRDPSQPIVREGRPRGSPP